MTYAASKPFVNAHIAGGGIDVAAAIRTITTANTNALNKREYFRQVAESARSTVAIHPKRIWKIMKRGANQLYVLDLVN